MDKSRQRIQWKAEKENTKNKAEKTEYTKLEADIKHPAISTD